MNVLFYYDPVSHRGDSLWRRAHPGVDSQMYHGLMERNDKRDTQVRLLINECYAPKMPDYGIAERDLITVREEPFVALFDDPHADLNRLWYEKTNTAAQMEGVAALIQSKLQGFKPDVIITWTPAPFLRQLFPDALLLHKEMGLFQRAPYPATFFLDPLGFYGDSLLTRRIAALKDQTAPAPHLAVLDQLRQHFLDQITNKTPFGPVMATQRERFRKLLLLPLQYNGYFTFDGMCRFRTQMALAETVLRNTPDDVGVILTRHVYGNLSDEELIYLRQHYRNAVVIEEAEQFHNPSDLLMPFIDGVVTVTSTIGLKAVFWRKSLISLGTPYLDWLDDATSLGDVARVLSRPYHPAKDTALAWFLLCYSIPQHFNGTRNWTRTFLERLVTRYREDGADGLFTSPITDPAHLGKELIRVTNRNFPTRDEQRALVDMISGWPAEDRAALLECRGPRHDPVGPAQRQALPPMAKRRLVFLYASGRWNASGLYLQDLARNLTRLGIACLILAEGDIPAGGIEDGVQWRRFAFDGYLLAPALKQEIISFAPDALYVINVRTKPMRTALELHVTLGATIVVQSEDDDLLIFEKFHKHADPALLELLDRPKPGNAEIREFLARIDWPYTLGIWRGTIKYRDVEPLLRVACYRLATLHTAIWQPLADKLERAFAKPTLVVPPVIELSGYASTQLTEPERRNSLSQFGIDAGSLVVFLAGTIYDFSPEFETFLRSLAIASEQARLTLVIAGRSRVKVAPLVAHHLGNQVAFRDLGTPDDDDYHAMMRAADVIAAPGYPDQFNRLRLSSRLVKAMAHGKPIFTYRCGFGESLRHGHDAILTDGIDPREWADKLLILTDPQRRYTIGVAARRFAEEHFDAGPVAQRLAHALFSELPLPASDPVPVTKATAPPRPMIQGGRHAQARKPRSSLVRKTRKLLRDPRSFVADSRLILVLRGRRTS